MRIALFCRRPFKAQVNNRHHKRPFETSYDTGHWRFLNWTRINAVEVPRVAFEKLSSQRTGEPSEKVRERVQRERFKGTKLQTNSDMGPAEIRQRSALWAFCQVDEAAKSLLKAATPESINYLFLY